MTLYAFKTRMTRLWRIYPFDKYGWMWGGFWLPLPPPHQPTQLFSFTCFISIKHSSTLLSISLHPFIYYIRAFWISIVLSYSFTSVIVPVTTWLPYRSLIRCDASLVDQAWTSSTRCAPRSLKLTLYFFIVLFCLGLWFGINQLKGHIDDIQIYNFELN